MNGGIEVLLMFGVAIKLPYFFFRLRSKIVGPIRLFILQRLLHSIIEINFSTSCIEHTVRHRNAQSNGREKLNLPLHSPRAGYNCFVHVS